MSVIAVILALAPAAPADATTWPAGRRAPQVVTLAGSSIEWIVPLREYDAVALYEAHRGGRPRRLQRFPAAGQYGSFHPAGFAGSRAGVAFERSFSYDPPGDAGHGGSDLYVGPVGSPLRLILRCDAYSGYGLDISGSILVYSRCLSSLALRDLRTGSETTLPETNGRGLRIAGRYLAWLQGGAVNPDIVVYDREAQAEAYRIPGKSLPSSVESLDLQDDGTVIFAFDTNPNVAPKRVVVAWASTSQPTPHRLPLAPRFSYSTAISHDRVAFERDVSNKAYGTDLKDLGVSDLRGRSRLIERGTASYGFDFDGLHLAYVRRSCGAFEIVRTPWHARLHRPRRCR